MVGGTGLYITSLIDNVEFAETGSSLEIRGKYKQMAEEQGNAAVLEKLREVDPETAAALHENNIGRVIRALELYELTGIPMSRHKELSKKTPGTLRALLYRTGLSQPPDPLRPDQSSGEHDGGGWPFGGGAGSGGIRILGNSSTGHRL